MNSPDLGLTPSLAIASQLVDPRAAGLASCLSYWFNFGNNPQPVLCPDLGFNFEGLDSDNGFTAYADTDYLARSAFDGGWIFGALLSFEAGF